MKYMNTKKKYQSLDLQLFAGEDGEDDGAESGEEDQDDDPDEEDGDDDPDEKKFSQKDVDAAVKKQLAKERRKWQREQQKKSGDREKSGDEKEDTESEDVKARKAAEDRASKAEVKVACYEAGVAKDAVEDVAALAHSYMATDEDLDLEEAIEKVVKKYPHFKKGADDSEDGEGEGKKKSWGQRQSGKGGRKMSGVEERFYQLNPDLKK